MARRLGSKLWELALLFLLVGLLAVLSSLLGISTLDYARFAPVFALFLLPGWCCSGLFLRQDESRSLAPRLTFTLLFSYMLYSWIALSCRFFSLGYEVFLPGFLIGTVAATALWLTKPQADTGSQAPGRSHENTLVLYALIVAVTFYSQPYSNDQGLFDLNIFESLDRREFSPSSLDVLPFGVLRPQPRMEANLFHALFAVLGFAADVSPRVLIYYVATPFLGIILLLAMTVFLAEVSGPRVNRAFVFAAILLPWTLFYRGENVYWYEYRILNSPTLDKDFATFFLLPTLLLLAWRHLVDGSAKYLAVLIAGIPIAIWTHPVTLVYFCAGAAGLAISTVTRLRLGRAISLVVCGVCALIACMVLIRPAETHSFISELAAIDSQSKVMHFGRGHYTAEGQHLHPAVTITYCCGQLPIVKPRYYFGSALIGRSTSLTFLWLGAFAASCLLRRFRLRYTWSPSRETEAPSPGFAASRREAWSALALLFGTGLAAASVYQLARPTSGLNAAMLAGSTSGAGTGLLLIGISSWFALRPSQGRFEPDGRVGGIRRPSIGSAGTWSFRAREADALRVQAMYASLLVLTYVGSALIMAAEPSLWRGLNRLHWMYFGFFPFVFIGAYLWALVVELVRWLGTPLLQPRRRAVVHVIVAWVPYVLVGLHVLDQAVSYVRQEPTRLSRLGLGTSIATAPGRHRHNALLTNWIRSLDGERGADAPLQRPAWMREGDVVIHLSNNFIDKYRIGRHKYEILRHAGYYRELYSEAFALQEIGKERFLPGFFAYNDAIDSRVTPRLVDWLQDRGVTVIMTRSAKFIRELQTRWPKPIARVGSDGFDGMRVYRLRDPAG